MGSEHGRAMWPGFQTAKYSTTGAVWRSGSVGPQRGSTNRVVVLELQLLSRTGTVRALQVWKGPETLRAKAIRDATRREYQNWIGYAGVSLEVSFPVNNSRPPDIRELRNGGVPGRVHGGTSLIVVLPALPSQPIWLSQLLSTQPISPVLEPAPIQQPSLRSLNKITHLAPIT